MKTATRTVVKNLRATKDLAKRLAERLLPLNGAVVLFDAPMGAGKTTFISAVIKCLDSSLRVSSPTFAIINKYTENIYHADLYRVGKNDIENTGLFDILADKKNFVFVEWAGALSVPNAINIKINILEGDCREFIIT
jgi:tRNA threonylcarbamoyladenosine biosynthesis protein TsaE